MGQRKERTKRSEMLNKVRAAAVRRGGKCLEKTYRPRPAQFRFRCSEGHAFQMMAGNVLYYDQWCPQCSRQPTQEYVDRLEAVLQERGGRMVRSSLGKLSEPHRFVCDKGHWFSQLPTRVVNAGTWCPKCSYIEKGERMRLGLEAANAYAESRGGRCLATEYKTLDDTATWECKEGHVWEVRFKSVMDGKWCPDCWTIRRRMPRKRSQMRQRKLTIEYCQELARGKGGQCLMKEYFNYHDTSMAWRCEKGHEWFASLASMELRDDFCAECAKVQRKKEWLEKMRAFAAEHGGQCLSREWVGNKHKLRWRCAKGHEFSRCWDTIRTPPFCADCLREETYQQEGEERLCAIAERHGGFWIESEYKGIREKYEFECAKGHRFEATPATADRSWGKYCACGISGDV